MGNLCSDGKAPILQTKTIFNCVIHKTSCTSRHLTCKGHNLCLSCEYKSIEKQLCLYCFRSLTEFELAYKKAIEGLCFACEAPHSEKRVICECLLCSKCINTISLMNYCPNCLKKTESLKKTYPCIVCTLEFTRDEMLTLECEHYFCQTCIEYHIKMYLKERTQDLRINKGTPCFNCESFIDINIIKSILNSTDFDHYLRVMVEANECPNCHLPYFTDDQKVICTQCSYFFCNSCLRKANECKCDQEEIITGIDMSACPGCRSLYAKDEGCNHVKCMKPDCKEEFCFMCSAKRSPAVAHGCHYHRPQCKFYSEYDASDDKYSEKCKECVKSGKLCKRPKNLKIPRRINKDEV